MSIHPFLQRNVLGTRGEVGVYIERYQSVTEVCNIADISNSGNVVTPKGQE